MPRSLSPYTPLTLADLASAGKWLRYSLIPFLAVLIGFAVWAHDTSAAVKSLKHNEATRDADVAELKSDVKTIDGKLDLLIDLHGRPHGSPQ